MYDKTIRAWLEEAVRRPDLSKSTRSATRAWPVTSCLEQRRGRRPRDHRLHRGAAPGWHRAWLLRAQVDPATAASLTGHSIDVMLKHYREVTDGDRRAAAERAMLGVLDELPGDGRYR